MNRFLFVVFALSCLNGCASPLRGKVIEKGSEKPVEGAIVYAQWMSYGGFIDSRTSCVQVDFSTTDANGRYELPNLNASDTLKPHLGVYKPGYVEYLDIDYVTGRITRYPGTPGEKWLEIRPFEGTVMQRLEQLQDHRNHTSCRSDIDKSSLLPLYRALYQEAQQVAKTRQEREKASSLLFSIEVIELGRDEAHERLKDRWSRGEY